MRRIVLIFIDGLGVGKRNPKINPCCHQTFRFFNNFLDDDFRNRKPFGGIVSLLDTTLGVDGLPQSATGQTALLTGVNAAKVLNRHLQGFPNETLRRIIKQESILKKLKDQGKRIAFINTYTPIFFELGPEALERRLSVTSIASLAANFQFFNFEDMKNERSIYQDFTNQSLISKYPDLPIFTPQKAGKIFSRASRNFDFSFFEYFQTDRAGHSQDMARAQAELSKLEQFLDAFLRETDLTSTFVLLTSDHGNIEDLSVRMHTKNPAMTMAWGLDSEKVLQKLKTILDVTPTLIQFLTKVQ